METFLALARFVTGLWNINTPRVRGYLRFALSILLLWPIVAIIFAAIGHGFALVAIPYWSFMLVGPIIILIWQYPIITALAATVNYTRSILRDICLVIAFELAIGIYFAVVPVANNRALIPLLTMGWIALLAFSVSTKTKWSYMVQLVIAVMIFVLTFIFMGWERELMKTKSAVFSEPGYMAADGNYIPPRKGVIGENLKKMSEKKWVSERQMIAEINCDEYFSLIDLEPGETVLIQHQFFGFGAWEKKNRCSYDAIGTAYPVFGAENRVHLSEFIGDVPKETLPPHALVFFVMPKNPSPEGSVALAYYYITKNGGSITIPNEWEESVSVSVVPNMPQSVMKRTKGQIGYDGSTTTLSLMKM